MGKKCKTCGQVKPVIVIPYWERYRRESEIPQFAKHTAADPITSVDERRASGVAFAKWCKMAVCGDFTEGMREELKRE